MHIDQLRTFLEVAATGNFHRASTNLNVTQSTVSARIRTLESRLGHPVFLRNPSGITLTQAGVRLQRHAVNIVRLWQRAEEEASLSRSYERTIGFGTVISLMNSITPRWISWMRDAEPSIALHVQADFSNYLMRQLIDGVLDLAVMYEPRHTPGLVIEEILIDEIILASTERSASGDKWKKRYIYVDWGESFRREHDQALPDVTPSIHCGLGQFALDYILNNGGSGYFPVRLVDRQLRQGTLHRVRGTPTMSRTGFVVYSRSTGDPELIKLGLKGLREILDRPA